MKGFNDFKTFYQEIANQAHGWDPEKVTKSSGKKLPWICDRGHIWEDKVCNRTQGNSGCPYCSGRRVLAGFNDLATTHPTLAAEAMGWEPTMYSQGMKMKLRWKCANDHIFEMRITEHVRGNNCPFCSRRSTLKGDNDLATTHPELAAEAHCWDPSEITSSSTKLKDWRCAKGHIYRAKVNVRARCGTGCPYCSGQKVLAGFNDLASKHPRLSKEANGWDPAKVTPGSNTIKNWKCELGHKFEQQVAKRAIENCGCPYCAGRKVLVGFNDLATLLPEVAKEAYEWDAKTVTKGSNAYKKWKCSLGHIYKAQVCERTRQDGSGCPYCSGAKVMKGFNDLATLCPDIAKEAQGWDPSTVTRSSFKK